MLRDKTFRQTVNSGKLELKDQRKRNSTKRFIRKEIDKARRQEKPGPPPCVVTLELKA